jgi:hypothetical protein
MLHRAENRWTEFWRSTGCRQNRSGSAHTLQNRYRIIQAGGSLFLATFVEDTQESGPPVYLIDSPLIDFMRCAG